jgi:phage tail-like protein
MRKILNKLFGPIPALAIRTTSLDPLQKFNYRMTIPGLPTSIGWQKVSGLSEEIGVAEYDEAGYGATRKLPGRVKVPEVTCERGEFADVDLKALVHKSITDAEMRTTIIVEKLDRYNNVAKTYKLAEAWVSKWEGSDMDASSDDVSIEKITIQFEYYL